LAGESSVSPDRRSDRDVTCARAGFDECAD
jgi:hypothetical protein